MFVVVAGITCANPTLTFHYWKPAKATTRTINTIGIALKIIDITLVSPRWANKLATLAEAIDETRIVKHQFLIWFAKGPGFEPELGEQNENK